MRRAERLFTHVLAHRPNDVDVLERLAAPAPAPLSTAASAATVQPIAGPAGDPGQPGPAAATSDPQT